MYMESFDFIDYMNGWKYLKNKEVWVVEWNQTFKKLI
jgi:tRNA A37 threonylcarbamoyladenosine biosynthesis protein TsaE